MKIHLLSDLHLEFYKADWREHVFKLVKPADVLVLAGDIQVGRDNVRNVLKFFATHYKDIIYIPGNHEYYGGLELNGFDIFANFEAKLPSNVRYLNARSIVIGDLELHGATLWTDFGKDPLAEESFKRYIVDYRRIPDATPDNIRQMYDKHAGYLKLAYERRDRAKKQVFVTHFLPAYECIALRWRNVGFVESLLNKYFAANLGDWIATLDNATWLFGHTHDSVDVEIGTTRCLARPYGYPGEHKEAYEHLVLEL